MLVQNKKAGLNYEIRETFDAGIELRGFEVKALRQKHGSLEGAYVIVRGGEVFLIKAAIPPYQNANTPKDYDPERPRKLLLTRAEIGTLADCERKKGLTIIPLSVYSKGRKIKVSIATARGKKKYDKREDIKKRDMERDIRREMHG